LAPQRTRATITVTVAHTPIPNNPKPIKQPHTHPAQGDVRLGMTITRAALLGITAAGIVLEHGFYTQHLQPRVIHLIQAVLLGVYVLNTGFGSKLGRRALHEARTDGFHLVLIALCAVGVASEYSGMPGGWRLFELATGLLLMSELWRLNVGLSRRFYQPGILLPISFITMIAVGAVLLKTPKAVPAGQTITWLDALFTMTSAVCVTGLSVRDTATQFTPFGQTIIGVFIQLGGLGIIIFGSMLAMLLGTSLTLRENISLSGMLNDLPLHRITSHVRFIVLTTLGFELAGAVALGAMSGGDGAIGQRFAMGLFHSVSAFCNAGFTLHSDGFESSRYAPRIHLVIIPLVVIGGLGFPVLENLWRVVRSKWRPRRASKNTPALPDQSQTPHSGKLSLHTKVVLSTTAALYLYGVVGIAVGQLQPYTHDLFQQGVTANRVGLEPPGIRQLGATLADASFMSLSSRTAGFNTVPMEELSPAGRFVVMTLMMVGASPGGTGGGMKTTTLALLLLTIAATIRQRGHTDVFARRISEELVRKAATLAACFVALATAATGLLTLSEPYPFGKIAFEAVSAASTTGLSLGITGDLTGFGKAVIIATMFLGRIGPLALLGALLFRNTANRPYTYPHEHVVMG